MIHDLRNPLASIVTGAEMLMNLELNPDQIRRLGLNIHKAAGRMWELLASLVQITGGRADTGQSSDVREVLAGVCEEAAFSAGVQAVRIHLDVPAGIEITMGRIHLERVFTNLITNSLEAMPGGGEICIAARGAGDCAVIEVEDSGPGIPAEILHRLFEPFATAGKKHGVGLGLALSRRIVRDHGGDMWIEPAMGARFLIRLRLKRSIDVLD